MRYKLLLVLSLFCFLFCSCGDGDDGRDQGLHARSDGSPDDAADESGGQEEVGEVFHGLVTVDEVIIPANEILAFVPALLLTVDTVSSVISLLQSSTGFRE